MLGIWFIAWLCSSAFIAANLMLHVAFCPTGQGHKNKKL